MESNINPAEASMHLKTLVETMRKNKFHSNPRWFKVGDVVKWTPAHVNQDKVRGRGLAVVIEANGPQVKVYWLGSGELTEHDVRMPQVFQLQDLAPMPEVAQWLKTIQREFV